MENIKMGKKNCLQFKREKYEKKKFFFKENKIILDL